MNSGRLGVVVCVSVVAVFLLTPIDGLTVPKRGASKNEEQASNTTSVNTASANGGAQRETAAGATASKRDEERQRPGTLAPTPNPSSSAAKPDRSQVAGDTLASRPRTPGTFGEAPQTPPRPPAFFPPPPGVSIAESPLPRQPDTPSTEQHAANQPFQPPSETGPSEQSPSSPSRFPDTPSDAVRPPGLTARGSNVKPGRGTDGTRGAASGRAVQPNADEDSGTSTQKLPSSRVDGVPGAAPHTDRDVLRPTINGLSALVCLVRDPLLVEERRRVCPAGAPCSLGPLALNHNIANISYTFCATDQASLMSLACRLDGAHSTDIALHQCRDDTACGSGPLALDLDGARVQAYFCDTELGPSPAPGGFGDAHPAAPIPVFPNQGNVPNSAGNVPGGPPGTAGGNPFLGGANVQVNQPGEAPSPRGRKNPTGDSGQPGSPSADSSALGVDAAGSRRQLDGGPPTDGAQPRPRPGLPPRAQEGSEAAIPNSEAARPSSEGSRPGTDAARPSSEGARPGSEVARPGTDAARPSSERARPGSDAARPSNEGPSAGTPDNGGQRDAGKDKQPVATVQPSGSDKPKNGTSSNTRSARS